LTDKIAFRILEPRKSNFSSIQNFIEFAILRPAYTAGVSLSFSYMYLML
jgi:hypothetical protein